jgi:RNA methyltransferase, TrmH family
MISQTKRRPVFTCKSRLIAESLTRFGIEEIIVSLTRTELKDIQSLLTKKGRKEKRRFVAEGVRLLEDAIRFRTRPELILYTEHGTTGRGKELVESYARDKVRVEELPAKQLAQLTDTESPQGLVGVFRIPPQDLAELSSAGLRRYLLCEHVGDPGNLGTLLRSALAFGFEAVIASGQTAEFFSPKVVRSSAGAVLGLRVAVAPIEDVIAFTVRNKITLVATGRTGAATVESSARSIGKRPLMLAIGSEADGISTVLSGAATHTVRIDHEPEVESLNAAVAGSILMKEYYSLWTERK